MEKLNCLDWAEGLTLSAFGVRVGVRVNLSGELTHVLPVLPPGWKKSQRSIVQRLYSLVVPHGSDRPELRRLHVLYADSTQVARDASLDHVLAAFETDLHRYIAEASSDMTFLHAGVVSWQGRTIVVPGRSFSGKTTLVREMLRLGATYYSDEFAVVDNFGLVHPFARPLGIREDSSYARTKYTVERLGAASGVTPLPMGMAVICKYETGAQWEPAPLSQGQGALELLANSVAVRTQPHRTLRRLQKLVRHAVFIKGTRGEAHEAAESILNLSCTTWSATWATV
jgi:hypothetical protein